MNVFVAGATGLLGRALVTQLVPRGHAAVGSFIHVGFAQGLG